MHNADSTISYVTDEDFQYGVISQTNISQYTNSFIEGMPASLLWHNYEFDDKKDPLLNVLGMDKIGYTFLLPVQFGHNVTNYYTTRADGAFNQQIQTSTYTYNAQGYPVTEHRVDISDIYDIQYFYE